MPVQDRPRIVCLMTSSLDGSLHPSRWTALPDGASSTKAYEAIHNGYDADGWIVGRVTMAEMAKGTPHPPADPGSVERPCHFAKREGPFAIAIDRSAKLHFDKPDIDGDPVVVLLGHDVPDAHLAELAADGVSYIVAEDAAMDLGALLGVLKRELGIELLLLEGGAGVNGSFLAAGLVDAFSVVLAPALDGRDGQTIVDAGDEGLAGRIALTLTACETLDHGFLHLRYAVTPTN